VHSRKNKTDDKDAEMILDEVRAYLLAGRPLPSVWVPDHQTRDDREPVRLRLQVAQQRARIKNQIRTLAKRWHLPFPEWFRASEWSQRSLAWMEQVAAGPTANLPARSPRPGHAGGATRTPNIKPPTGQESSNFHQTPCQANPEGEIVEQLGCPGAKCDPPSLETTSLANRRNSLPPGND
jgi:hypothetical protein